MFRRLKATKDTYITNKIIKNDFRATDANVGQAATLDLFKLYNENNISGEDEPVELTRLLVKFDLDPLRALTGSVLDIASDSFRCDLKLYDVFGGQTLPSNFKVIVFPLSQSFDEGVGRDVIKFQDIDSTNFLTASVTGDTATLWHISGANALGQLGEAEIDIIASGNLSDGSGVQDLFSVMTFDTGTEDLSVDVTTVVSATLANQIPDYGFRISFSGTQETDRITRFVKRFASSENSNTYKHPALQVRFNDAIQDHHESFFFNVSGSIFLNSFERGQPANLLSGSNLVGISGSDCMSIMVKTASFEKEISGSQHNFGASLFATGVYSSSFMIDAFDTTVISGSTTVADFVRDSGSITFDVFWRTNDKSYTFKTGSLTVKTQQITAFDNDTTRYVANIGNLRSSYRQGEKVRLRFFAYDYDEQVTAVKVPLYRASDILTRCYYRVRDAYSDEIIIPFDEEDTFNATLMSTDSKGMYFDLYTADFSLGRVYTIDVKIKRDNTEQVFKNVAGTFRIDP